MDVFTCGEVIDPNNAHEILREAFQPTSESIMELLKRGLLRVPQGTLPKAYSVTE